MTQTNPVHPDVRRFAIETGADDVSPMSNRGSARIEYSEDFTEIIHVGSMTDIPDGYVANLTFVPTPTIDLFPD